MEDERSDVPVISPGIPRRGSDVSVESTGGAREADKRAEMRWLL